MQADHGKELTPPTEESHNQTQVKPSAPHKIEDQVIQHPIRETPNLKTDKTALANRSPAPGNQTATQYRTEDSQS